MNLAPVDRLATLADAAALELRERFIAAGYDDDLIMALADVTQGGSPREARLLCRQLLTRRGDAAAALARLFAYGDTLSTSEADGVLGASLLGQLHDAGLVDASGDVTSMFPIRPLEGVWLLCDDSSAGPEAAMPPGGTTRQLVTAMPPRIDQAVLDVGCGPGSLTFVAAVRGAPHAVGTDVNPRALEMAHFNARLNGLVDRTEFLLGDLTTPVAGRTFALVLAQPPYVLQPPDVNAVTYLHGGQSGEEIGMRLFAALPDVLAPGGTALVLMEAIARSDEAFSTRVRRALGDAQADVLVLAAAGPPLSIVVYASAALETAGGGAELGEAIGRYVEHVESLGVSSLQHTLSVIRAHAPEWPHERISATVPVRDVATGDAAALARLLAGIDLAALSDAEIGQQAVRPAVRTEWLERRARPDAPVADAWSVRFGPGTYGRDFDLAAERYAMAAALTGSVCIDDAIESFARRVEQPTDAVRRDVLAFVREGLMRGLFEVGSSVS